MRSARLAFACRNTCLYKCDVQQNDLGVQVPTFVTTFEGRVLLNAGISGISCVWCGGLLCHRYILVASIRGREDRESNKYNGIFEQFGI